MFVETQLLIKLDLRLDIEMSTELPPALLFRGFGAVGYQSIGEKLA